MLINRQYHEQKQRNLTKTPKSLCVTGLSFCGKVTSNYYPGSRGPLSKYLIWNKPRLRFDKVLETDLRSHKQATSFPCEKSVQNLNWVADWLFPRPQGISMGNSKICSDIWQKNTTSDISKLLYVISRAVRRVKFEIILKYHRVVYT